MVEIAYLIVGLVVGVVAGGWIYRTFLADQRLRQLETELSELRREYEDYQLSVSTHFERTANLARQLTDNYREMHEHLRKGAQTLMQQPIDWHGASSQPIEHHDLKETPATLTPPKDY